MDGNAILAPGCGDASSGQGVVSVTKPVLGSQAHTTTLGSILFYLCIFDNARDGTLWSRGKKHSIPEMHSRSLLNVGVPQGSFLIFVSVELISTSPMTLHIIYMGQPPDLSSLWTHIPHCLQPSFKCLTLISVYSISKSKIHPSPNLFFPTLFNFSKSKASGLGLAL